MSLSPQGNAANLRSTDRARAIFATLYYLLLKLIDFHLICDSLQCKSVMQISREEWSLQRLTSHLPLQSQHFFFLPLSSLSASLPTFQVLLSHFIDSPSVECLVLALLLRPHGGLSWPSANSSFGTLSFSVIKQCISGMHPVSSWYRGRVVGQTSSHDA